ncbi:MAG: hypothetical protein GC147_04345 [Porphyrobacter sp.]|nr:hypothetical protein [Porphyrobacter sp.]
MIKTASRMMTAAAAASMVIAPVALQANTRAGDSGAMYSAPAAQPGLGREADGESIAGAGTIVIGLLATAAVVVGIIKATSSEDEGQSPGT